MAEITSCPHCQRKLRVPAELLGRQVKCPGCGQQFTASVGGAAPPPPPDAPPPPPPPPTYPGAAPAPAYSYQQPQAPAYGGEQFEADTGGGSDYTEMSGWRSVRTGVTLILSSICVSIGSVVLYFCGLFGLASGGRGANRIEGLIVFLGMLFLGGMLASFILWIVGQIYCLGAPNRYGAQTLSRVSFGLVAGGLFLLVLAAVTICSGISGLAGTMSGLTSPAEAIRTVMMSAGVGLVFSFLGALCLHGYQFTFLFFLRATALGVAARGLAQSIVYLIGVFGAYIIINISYNAMTIMALGSLTSADFRPGRSNAAMELGNPLMTGCTCLMVLLALTSFIWLIVSLVQVRTAIDDYLRRGRVGSPYSY